MRVGASAFDDASGLHYNLPGGGVDAGEAVRDAVAREAWEEARARITAGRLLLAWEYAPWMCDAKFGPTHYPRPIRIRWASVGCR